MPRQIKTAEQIQQLVHARVHRDKDVKEQGNEIRVQLPQQHEPDESGCNWRIGFSRNAPCHEEAILRTIEVARTQFNLP